MGKRACLTLHLLTVHGCSSGCAEGHSFQGRHLEISLLGACACALTAVPSSSVGAAFRVISLQTRPLLIVVVKYLYSVVKFHCALWDWDVPCSLRMQAEWQAQVADFSCVEERRVEEIHQHHAARRYRSGFWSLA